MSATSLCKDMNLLVVHRATKRYKNNQKSIWDHLSVILRPPQKSQRSVSSHPLVSHSAFCPANDGAMRLCSLSGLRHGTYDHDIGEMKHHFFFRGFLGLRYRILCRCSELYCFGRKMLRISTEHSAERLGLMMLFQFLFRLTSLGISYLFCLMKASCRKITSFSGFHKENTET